MKLGDDPYSKERPGNHTVHHFCSFYFLPYLCIILWDKVNVIVKNIRFEVLRGPKNGLKMSVCMFGRRCRYGGRYVDSKSSAKARSTFTPRWPFKKELSQPSPQPITKPIGDLNLPNLSSGSSTEVCTGFSWSADRFKFTSRIFRSRSQIDLYVHNSTLANEKRRWRLCLELIPSPHPSTTTPTSESLSGLYLSGLPRLKELKWDT